MRWAAVALSLSIAAVPVAVSAHHSVTAVYDREKAILLTGRLTRVEIVNPHSALEIEVRRPNGSSRVWKLEASGPGGMQRAGADEKSLPIGETVKVIGYPARDGSTTAWLTRLETPDRVFDFSFRRGQGPRPVPTS